MADLRPNILLITTDQQRGDCLGIEDHPVLQSPYLDWVGASGIRCSRAYSACPVCGPARRTLITGRRPVNHGATMNGPAPPITWPTLATELATAGYQTHMVGKSHFGPAPTEIGFQTASWADNARAGGDNEYQRFLKSSGIDWPRASDAHGMPSNGFPVRSFHLEERFHFTNWCADRAIEFLEGRERNRPFFLMVNFLHPHQPLTPPPFYYDRYMAMELPEPYVGDWARVFEKPKRGLPPECWRLCLDPPVMKQMRAAYYGSINHIDDQIARFLLPAPKYVLPANTIVVFTSDHGEMLGDHQWLRKRTPYEPSARVPLLLNFPEEMEVRQERVIDRPVELMEIMPTLLEAVGLPVPDTVDGASLMPLLRDREEGWREFIHGECAIVPTTGGGMQYLTDGRRKYIWWPGRGVEQYFNLEEDPDELVDLASDPRCAEEVAAWRDRLVAELRGRPERFTDGKKLISLET